MEQTHEDMHTASTRMRIGTAVGLRICPRQYANSCFNNADGSEKHRAIWAIDEFVPQLRSRNSARKRSFRGRLQGDMM